MSAQHDQLIKTFGCHGATLLVHATADAEAICQKSSLSAAELLRPFTFVDTSFSITTVGEPYKLSGFHLRFVHTSEFKELTAAAADQHLTRLLSAFDCSDDIKEAERRDLKSPAGPAQSLPPLRILSVLLTPLRRSGFYLRNYLSCPHHICICPHQLLLVLLMMELQQLPLLLRLPVLSHCMCPCIIFMHPS